MSILSRKLMGATSGGILVDDVFSTTLYTGNGSAQTITTGINPVGKGGLFWVKERTSVSIVPFHFLNDTVRGQGKQLIINLTDVEGSSSGITSFNEDGFSVGDPTGYNANTGSFVSWSFCIAPRFLDIVTYTGDGVAGRTIPHNLGVKPGMIVVKRRDSTGNWAVYHRSNTAAPETDYLLLNTAAATVDLNTYWNDTAPTNSVFTVGNNADVNASGGTYVTYVFAHDSLPNGVIQCGSYTGNGSATGPIISLGWEPQWLLVKRADSTGDWWIYDNARDTSNPRTFKLVANSSAAEDTAGEDLDFTSSGFQTKTTAAGINASGGSYIYMAIRKEDA